MSPCLSANINSVGNTTEGSRICTQLGSSKTIRGLSALNHSNLTSPLNSAVFRDGFEIYSYTAMRGSMTLLELNDEVEEGEEDLSKPMTFKDFKDKNSTATRKDYFKYLKDRIAKMKKEASKEIPEEPGYISDTPPTQPGHVPGYLEALEATEAQIISTIPEQMSGDMHRYRWIPLINDTEFETTTTGEEDDETEITGHNG
jgi:hypothetical protein